MPSNWAAENLQVIRTLMERSALYRRTLAPMMLWTGGIGAAGAALALALPLDAPPAFVGYWLAVSLAAILGALLIVRRQALGEGEPFLSPPTRRVLQALAPAYVAALLISLAVLVGAPRVEGGESHVRQQVVVALLCVWMVLYGCAAHAAGFFMQRGIKLFGWIFVIGGAGLLWLPWPPLGTTRLAHLLMGSFFGGLHLAYGAYLYFTDKRKHVE